MLANKKEKNNVEWLGHLIEQLTQELAEAKEEIRRLKAKNKRIHEEKIEALNRQRYLIP